MSNLPAVPGGIAFKDRPEAVKVISRGDTAPSIVRRMSRVALSDETVVGERERYSNANGLNLHEKSAVAAYDALADGRVLIDLQATLAKNIDNYKNARLQLAIAHPRMHNVYMRRFGTNEVFEFYANYKVRGKKLLNKFYTVEYDNGRRGESWSTFEALVPSIPVEVREQHPNHLTDNRYLVMWEADWKLLNDHQPRPPILDPALLYQVSGSLYSVIAVWDLTPIEASALRPGPTF